MQGLRTVALPLGTALAGAALATLVFATLGRQAATAQGGQAGEIRAERLTIVGDDGTPRLIVGERDIVVPGTMGSPLMGTGLVVLGADGRTPRLAQGVTTDGAAGMIVYGEDGRPRLSVGTGGPDGRDDGSVGIAGFDPLGRPRFELFFTPAEQGRDAVVLNLLGQAGHRRAALAARADGGIGLFLHDQTGRQRARVGIPPDGIAPEVVLFDEAGAVVWQTP